MGCTQSKTGKEAKARAEQQVGQRGLHISLDARMEKEWHAGDKNGDGVLSFKEVKSLLHKLNVSIPERELKKKFKAFDSDGNGDLDFGEFQELFKAVQSRPDLTDVFKAAAANQEAMVAEELQRFLTSSSSGRVMPSIVDCARMIMRVEGAPAAEVAALQENADDEDQFLEDPLLSYEGFQRLMCNPEVNGAMDHEKFSTVYQDMSQPLSHYYVSASHNTYLTGNQLSSESSGSAVARALKLGVRVIELDAWDGPDGQPIVNHGHTMCKPVSMQDCLDAIKENAFSASKYAVVITIENHCSLPQQKVQVEMLKSTFGGMLYQWEGVTGEDGKRDWTRGPPEWASPEDLKGKIVIRDKPIKKKSKKGKKGAVSSKDEMDDGDSGADRVPGPGEAPTDTLAHPGSEIISLGSLSIDEDDEEEFESSKSLGTDEALLRAMYIKNVKLKIAHDKPGQRVVYTEPAFASSSSIVEGKMHKLSKAGYPMRDLAKYAERHLVRVYPAGSRVDSSNYDPSSAWNAGCQIVALNYQTHSMPVWLNQGKFSDNGGCGYVLKPEFLLPNAPTPWMGTPADDSYKLTVKVMSAHYLPKPLGQSERSEVIDPYVEVTMHGLEADQKRFVTKHIDDNGFNPTWNETYSFNVSEPRLALLSFVINDHDLVGKDDFIAQAVLPVDAIVPGHKMVPLYHKNGAPQDSFLFVRFMFEPSPP